jgi:diguanylate cyclase (GGDEF)-like protein/PAS domain S-box-containing protein
MRELRSDPALRLSIGLISIVAVLLIARDALLEPGTDSQRAERKLRSTTAESLAVQVATLVEIGNEPALTRSLNAIVQRSPQIASIGVRRTGGALLAGTERHVELWQPPAGGYSTLTHVRVPLRLGSRPWGEVEVRFADPDAAGRPVWSEYASSLSVPALGAIGFLLFYFYLRRSLVRMQRAGALPERVRQAFDTLPGGVAVLDHAGRVLMVNRAFRGLHPAAARIAAGARLSEQGWITAALSSEAAAHPWSRCLAQGVASEAELLKLPRPDGGATQAVVRCAPILDDAGSLRGCLVSFDDVSELRQANERLDATLSQLEVSRQRMVQQSRQLRLLATRDPLTECLNRRAFFEEAKLLFAHARQQDRPLACIMADIDRFKAVNDRFGHGSGDAALRAVAALLASGLRQGDLLCRYGGEEFCMLLPGVPLDEAGQVAERLRGQVESSAAKGLRVPGTSGITCSFGVAALDARDAEVAALIDRADRLLDEAKRGGRNRVAYGAQRHDEAPALRARA